MCVGVGVVGVVGVAVGVAFVVAFAVGVAVGVAVEISTGVDLSAGVALSSTVFAAGVVGSVEDTGGIVGFFGKESEESEEAFSIPSRNTLGSISK